MGVTPPIFFTKKPNNSLKNTTIISYNISLTYSLDIDMSNRFKKAMENTEFTQDDVNSDAKVSDGKEKKDKEQIVTRNKSIINIEKNTLPIAKRVRTKHGRNLTIPLFVEELNVIDEAVKKLGQDQNISISVFIRESILQQCKKVLGAKEYQEILNNQLNVTKPKKEQ